MHPCNVERCISTPCSGLRGKHHCARAMASTVHYNCALYYYECLLSLQLFFALLLLKQLQVHHSSTCIIDRAKHHREKSNAECNPHGQAGKPGNVDLCYFNCLWYIRFSSGTLNSILLSANAKQIAELLNVTGSSFPNKHL